VDLYEAALQASCDALIALQLISCSEDSSDGLGYDVDRIARAIKSLRIAIEEVRSARDDPTSPLGAFVLEPRSGTRPPGE
jgi:hypothetical protein